MYDVVIVGGGVIGASAAWHLASRGCTRVLVLDAAPGPGQGSTGRATGGFRVQFGSEPNVRLSLLAREKLRRFADEVGVDPGYRPCGYLFLTEREETLAALLDAQTMQRSLGVDDARPVTVDEVLEINPAIAVEGLVGGVYCPSDGFTRPLEILRGYTEAAQRMGVRFEYGAPVRGIRVLEGRVVGVRTDAREVGAGAVVNAAGAWAGQVAAMAGADIPVTPKRRQVAVTEPFAALPECMPLTIFVESGFHLRVRDGRVGDALVRPARPCRPVPHHVRRRLAAGDPGARAPLAPVPARCEGGPRGVRGGVVRDVAGPPRAAGPRARRREPVSCQRLVGPRGDALPRARPAAGGDDPRRIGSVDGRPPPAPLPLRRRPAQPRAGVSVASGPASIPGS